VSIGEHAVVGAWYECSHGFTAGAAYVFRRNGENSWDEGAKLTAVDGIPNAWFGYSVSTDGEHLLVGAVLDSGEASHAGAVYSY
jgi:hypothetical protein